jgi:phage baseplate assembly protein W
MTNRVDRTANVPPIGPIYSDFMCNFNAHPNTGKLVTKTDAEAVRRSLRNLILTNRGERFYKPNLGSNINSLLFEPGSDIVSQQLQNLIKECIETYEKRVILRKIHVNLINEETSYNVDIYFSIINNTNTYNLNIKLDRLR